MTRSFSSYDGLRLSYAQQGAGPPLICLPGGPGRDPGYLGDLGGLGRAAGRELIFLHLRGTGDSAGPGGPATYRCDRMAEDVEALRAHLGLGQLDLLGHSAAGDLAMLYDLAMRYELAVQPGASYYPWLDNPALFTTTISAFLAAR
jgi:proline iminopeptidase